MNDTESGAGSAQSQRERLSALMDGELEAEAAECCCAQWREQTDARSSWHVYHLIGDVLRSEELACGAGRDVRLLAAVRSRLAAEPVVPAPGAPAGRLVGDDAAARSPPGAPTAPRRHWGWLAPVTVVVGSMVVASVMVVTQRPGAPASRAGETLASLPAASVAAQPIVVADGEPVPPAEAPVLLADGQLIRDAQLDRYLAAHKQFGGSSALGVPSGFLRSATLQAPAR